MYNEKPVLNTRPPEVDGNSLPEVHASVPTSQASLWRRMFAFAGPAYLVSVGYMDPGNWATDLEGGARFGYQLLWVLVMSNLMAILSPDAQRQTGDCNRARSRASLSRNVSALYLLRSCGFFARLQLRPAIWLRCWERRSD